MAQIRPERVKHALTKLHQWREAARQQASMHLLPLLALLEAKAGLMVDTPFEERPNEYDFWDKYFLLESGKPKPYFNPLSLRRAEENYPHSNSATIRKNTFSLKWHGATWTTDKKGASIWRLVESYADIFSENVLSKGGAIVRVPIVDLAIVLFRADSFPSGATAQTLEGKFKERFPQREDDYRKIFEFQNEEADNIFTDDPVPADEYRAAILATLVSEESAPSAQKHAPAIVPITDANDDVLFQVQQLVNLGTSGIIFRGPPGTGKTWYAQRVAASIVADSDADIFRVQFHPSFGYEDFVEGYRPDDAKKSGFNIVDKIFLTACARARAVGDNYVFLIADEINRGDPARIFGELLTYLEHSYREKSFSLPFSGRPFSIPENLILLGTMNPYDRSVSQIDAAFIRRFDHIELEPSREVVESMLSESKAWAEDQIKKIGDWFDAAQQMLPIGLGHSFFKDAADIDRLKLVWKYRIKPTAESILEFNPTQRDNFLKSFDALIARLEKTAGP